MLTKTFKTREAEKQWYETQESEEVFLKWYKEQEKDAYEKPSATVDNVIFNYNPELDTLRVLLIKRKAHPFKDSWALPGGFVKPTESSEQAVIRVVKDETGLDIDSTHVEQLASFDSPERDPRTWVRSVAHLVFLQGIPTKLRSDETTEAKWFEYSFDVATNSITLCLDGEPTIRIEDGDSVLEPLSFDHKDILTTAQKRIKGKLYYAPTILHLFVNEFTIPQTRRLYARFLGVPESALDNGNQYRKLKEFLVQTGVAIEGRGRPSKKYILEETSYDN